MSLRNKKNTFHFSFLVFPHLLLHVFYFSFYTYSSSSSASSFDAIFIRRNGVTAPPTTLTTTTTRPTRSWRWRWLDWRLCNGGRDGRYAGCLSEHKDLHCFNEIRSAASQPRVEEPRNAMAERRLS